MCGCQCLLALHGPRDAHAGGPGVRGHGVGGDGTV